MANKLTKKEEGFVKDYAKTGNGVQSALKNYDTEDYQTANQIAIQNLQKPIIQEAIKSIAESIPDEKVTQVILDGMEANKRVTSMTEPDSIDPDHPTRLKSADMAIKLKGLYAPEKTLNINADLTPILVKFVKDKEDEKEINPQKNI